MLDDTPLLLDRSTNANEKNAPAGLGYYDCYLASFDEPHIQLQAEVLFSPAGVLATTLSAVLAAEGTIGVVGLDGASCFTGHRATGCASGDVSTVFVGDAVGCCGWLEDAVVSV
ncbi:hypothetical protein FRC02_011690 [Tulasnella sp. 418]|nr:hypothetical protein FRC02_011690 [Tulasnella sp. 418]